MAIKLAELARQLGAELHGDGDVDISGVANLHHAAVGELSFLANLRYLKSLPETKASAVIIDPDQASSCPTNALLIKNPYAAYARAAQLLYPLAKVAAGIHPSAVVDKTATIADSASIGPYAVIAAGCQIGEGVVIGAYCEMSENSIIEQDSRLLSRVSLVSRVRIGKRSVIHPGAVIGGDGFGFANDEGEWIKIPQLGGVVIGDDVEVGCNTTIDRGALDDTVIAEGVKLDNLIQIAHNVQIGAHTAIAGCTGIAGSTRIGRRCAIGGGVGIAGHIEICDDVQLTGTTFVTQSISQPGTYSSGVPMEAYGSWRRNYTRVKQLDDMAKRLRRLEKRQQSGDEMQSPRNKK